MPTYRYLQISINPEKLSKLIPGGIVLGATGPDIFCDIIADASAKEDLDEVMVGLGWNFVSEDPTTTPKEQAATDNPLRTNVIDVSSGGGLVLDSKQYAHKILILDGVLLSSAKIEFPPLDGHQWIVRNKATLGINTIELYAAGSSVLVNLPVGTVLVCCDGVDLFQAAPVAT